MFRRRDMLRRMRGINMFRRVLVSGYVPFVLAPKTNAKKEFSMPQEKMYPIFFTRSKVNSATKIK